MNKPLLEALDAAARSAVAAVAAERDVIRRDRDRLRRWMQAWAKGRSADGEEGQVILLVDAQEVDRALRGEKPPKGGTR